MAIKCVEGGKVTSWIEKHRRQRSRERAAVEVVRGLEYRPCLAWRHTPPAAAVGGGVTDKVSTVSLDLRRCCPHNVHELASQGISRPRGNESAQTPQKTQPSRELQNVACPPHVRAASTGAAEATRLPSFDGRRDAEAQEAAGRHSESQERAAREASTLRRIHDFKVTLAEKGKMACD